jgi:2-hydroxychromene-2-carboxylate isomerase
MSAPVFYFDFNSPYAYLAAMRVDDVLPVKPVWQPISFGVIVRTIGKTPWSFTAQRPGGIAEIARRAEERGLPEVRYPEGWPVECYSLTPLRAALLADDQGLLREMTRELYATFFGEGRGLADVELVIAAGERAGCDCAQLREGLGGDEVKERLREATGAAIERGVTGVPTVAVGDELFWGDDRLQDAAAALA